MPAPNVSSTVASLVASGRPSHPRPTCRLDNAFLCAQVQAAFCRRARIQLAVAGLARAVAHDRTSTLATRAIVDAVCDGALVSRLPLPPPPTACHVLLFDGGSRGNPGAGGYGVLILRLTGDAPPAVVWAQAGYMADPRTTKNQAELKGLATGLARLLDMRPAQTVIIGDSQLVLNAMRHHRPFKHPGLARTYRTARATADRLRITGWYHHLRHHNKTADALANRAMDDGATTTWRCTDDMPLSRTDFPMGTHIANDLDPWLLHYSHLLVYAQAGVASGRQPEPA